MMVSIQDDQHFVDILTLFDEKKYCLLIARRAIEMMLSKHLVFPNLFCYC
jgi:hypothetical protein